MRKVNRVPSNIFSLSFSSRCPTSYLSEAAARARRGTVANFPSLDELFLS